MSAASRRALARDRVLGPQAACNKISRARLSYHDLTKRRSQNGREEKNELFIASTIAIASTLRGALVVSKHSLGDGIHSLAFLLALQKAPVLTPYCKQPHSRSPRVRRVGFPVYPQRRSRPRRPRVITHSSHNKSTLKLTYSLGQSSECVRDTIRAQYLNCTFV